MLKPILIAMIILFLQITTYACDWQNLSPQFLTALSSKGQVYKCQSTTVSTSEKIATINCVDQKNYLVFYQNDSIYMQTVSYVKNNLLTKCAFEGSISEKCDVQLNDQKCETWDLRTY